MYGSILHFSPLVKQVKKKSGPYPGTPMGLVPLVVSLVLITGIPWAPVQADPVPHRDGASLQWLLFSDRSESLSDCRLSVQLQDPEQTPRVARVTMLGPGGQSPPPESRVLRDRHLVSFPIAAGECGEHELKIDIEGRTRADRSMLTIPIRICGNPQDKPRHYLVPGFSLSGIDSETRWFAWRVEMENQPIVKLVVKNPHGEIVRSWLPNIFPPGDTTVLWDGRTTNGESSPPGEYILEIEPHEEEGSDWVGPTLVQFTSIGIQK